MKKLITSVLAILMISLTCFVGCGENATSSKAANKENKPSSSAAATTAKSGSKSWHDYSIVIDGTELKFPMSYKDFTEKGFKLYSKNDNTEETMLKPGYSMGTGYNDTRLSGAYTKGTTNHLGIYVHNTTKAEKNITECTVEGVYFIDLKNPLVDKYKVGEFTVKDNTTGKSATVGKTTCKDIESCFGPRYEYSHENDFYSYPDKNGDGNADISTDNMLHMYFDDETDVFSLSDFAYLNR